MAFHLPSTCRPVCQSFHRRGSGSKSGGQNAGNGSYFSFARAMYSRTGSSLWYPDRRSETRSVSTWAGSKPGRTLTSRAKLRTKRPAPRRSVSDNAISERPERAHPPGVDEDPDSLLQCHLQMIFVHAQRWNDSGGTPVNNAIAKEKPHVPIDPYLVQARKVCGAHGVRICGVQ